MDRKQIAAKTWHSKKYYQRIGKVDDLSHPAFGIIREYCQQAATTLDIGCGDGTKLNTLGGRRTQKVGLEISPAAIRLGRKKFPGIKFVSGQAEVLPFPNNRFDIVISTFVIEHTADPQKVVDEMTRVVKKKGYILILAPNFGAPNRSSPNFIGSRLEKLASGLLADLFNGDKFLSWNKVTPVKLNMEGFQSDQDTTVEPYLLSLERYLRDRGVRIIKADSYWSMELKNAKVWQKLLGAFGKLGLFPFRYWGPHLFVVGQKI